MKNYILTESQIESVGLNWLKDNFSNLTLKTISDYHVFLKDNDPVLLFDIDNHEISVSREKIIDYFVYDLNLEYSDIIQPIKKWVNDDYNIIPKSVIFVEDEHIMETLKKLKLEIMATKYFIENLGEFVKSPTVKRLGYFIKDGIRTAEVLKSDWHPGLVMLGLIGSEIIDSTKNMFSVNRKKLSTLIPEYLNKKYPQYKYLNIIL
jgi:hypothetical protein